MTEAEQEALLTAWVDRYSDVLLRMCFLQLRDYALAEDALQETFIKAWKALHKRSHTPIENERAWLMRIAINACRDVHRSRWMRHVDTSTAIDSLPPSRLAVEPEDRALMLDIMNLPEKFRQVLLLYHYQHLTMREAAQVLGVDVSTVHARLKKAEGMLRLELREEVDAP